MKKMMKNDTLAGYLIANGVTMREGKLLEAFLHPIDSYKGLKAKYLVFKADTGEMIDNCFILRPDKDAAAVEALRAYANATDNETLAEDIYNWVGKGESVQEWIPATERLPEKNTAVLALTDNGIVFQCLYAYDGWDLWEGHKVNITHWMRLPQPPEGE